ncbi:MAG TPA: methyltransferase [Pseudonocardia sp.]|jgi:hypothetical protein|nr:methyltransferase [Pseudonocardia sp.]
MGTIAQPNVDSRRLMDWFHGATALRVLGAVARLNLVESMGPGPVTLTELARRVRVPADQLARLTRALIELGLVDDLDEPRLTELGQLLRRDHPKSIRDLVLLATDPTTVEAWGNLDAAIRTGRSGFENAYGRSYFDYLTGERELSTTYHRAMGQLTRRIAETVPSYYDFTGVGTVLDIGGGDGTLLTSVLRSYPQTRGVLFDREEALPTAARAVEGAGLTERCAVTAGDFFIGIPAGADRYLLKWILHDWDDNHAAVILHRCREALPRHGRLLIIEQLLRSHPEPVEEPNLGDLTMLAIYGGKERTLGGFEELLRRTGLELIDVTALPDGLGVSILEVAPRPRR